MGILSRLVQVAPNELSRQARRGARLGKGALKEVFEDLDDAGKVIVEMRPHPPTEEFLRYARQAHVSGAPEARHLPNASELEPIEGGFRFRSERLQPNTKEDAGFIRKDGDSFGLYTGADDVAQRDTLMGTMQALNKHLMEKMPENHPFNPRSRYYYDLHPQNIMRRADGTLVINDPVAAALLALGGTTVGGGLLSRGRGQTA